VSHPFAIGVTGHRPPKLNPNRLDRVAADIAAVFGAMDRKFARRGVICVSSLAEGADTIAADAALALGWKLVAPVPFPAGHYARDFERGQPADDFRRLMLAAASVHVCTRDRLALRDDTEGYIAASAEMLRRSDALLAVWNGETTDLLAGAFDTLVKALAQDKKVLWIDSDGVAAPRYLTAAALPDISVGRVPPGIGGTAAFVAALD
jgi:hypothetical protein